MKREKSHEKQKILDKDQRSRERKKKRGREGGEKREGGGPKRAKPQENAKHMIDRG